MVDLFPGHDFSDIDYDKNVGKHEFSDDSEGMAQEFPINHVVPGNDGQDVTNFKNISICNSSNVHFGNKTFYNGPVTIKQIVYSAEHNVERYGSTPKADSHDECNTVLKYNCTDSRLNNLSAPAVLTNDFHARGEHKHSNPVQYQEASKSPTIWKTTLLRCRRLHCYYIFGVCAILLVTIVIALTIVVLKRDNKQMTDTSMPSDTLSGQTQKVPDNFTLPKKLYIKERQEWLAQPVSEPLDRLTTPVPYVIISHTASDNCSKIAECVYRVRLIQSFHVDSLQWSDIGYNFLVGGDGFAYAGRGWDYIGAHTYGYNNISIGISFIGTFVHVKPPFQQLQAAQLLIDRGVKLNKISKNYKLLGHRQLSATESPGQKLFDEIKKWPHWASTP